MKDSVIFSNLIGCFIFDKKYKILDSVKFKDINEYMEKEKVEKKLKLKYKEAIEPTESELKKILDLFKDKKYYSEFYKKNMDFTKKNIRDSVNSDLFIIQTINNIEDINKVVNTLAKRLRDWYELYNPEFSRSIEDHEKFSELLLNKSKDELLKEIKVTYSMGADLKPSDLKPIFNLAKEILSLYSLKAKQENYLKGLMEKICPNVTAITGFLIGAKLLEHAGSLWRLCELPASTVQLLGAEKALFRHMKTGARCPKYGVIFAHPFITRVKRENQGKIARTLADKISIAAKVDYFKGEFIGEKLRKAVEAKIK